MTVLAVRAIGMVVLVRMVVIVRVVVLGGGLRSAEPPQVAMRLGVRVAVEELAVSVQRSGARAAHG
jgi:hypothetical protein